MSHDNATANVGTSSIRSSIDSYCLEQRSLIELVRNKREQFFSDPGLRYGDLRTRLDAVLTEATSLEEAGKPREALAKLREIETLRRRPTARSSSMPGAWKNMMAHRTTSTSTSPA
jgi:hypothetical protein